MDVPAQWLLFIHLLRITFMRSSESTIVLAPHAARLRRRRDGEDAAGALTEEPQRQDGRAEAASTPGEEAGRWTVAELADTTDTQASESTLEGSTGGGVLPQAPSLSAAGVGLGIVGLIGTVAVGAGTKTQAMPSPKPVPPVKPIEPIEPIAPMVPVEPVEPITPAAPDKPVEPVTPMAPLKPVEPVTPAAPLKPVEPITPEKPVEPILPVLPKPASFSLSNAHAIESTTGTRELVFLVQRSGDTSASGQVSYSFEVDKDRSTVSKDEVEGQLQGLASFKPGESQQLIRLSLNGDHLRETDERVSIKLHDPVGGTLGRAEGNGTIHEVDVTRLQAAYGLRDLNTELDGPAIRVRRYADNKEADIGFDALGRLDREALLTFVGRGGSDKGYVTHWYDQSGHSRHMEMSDPSRQGVIVHGGSIVTRSDGSPAISFNAGRNGLGDDTMTSPGESGNSWRSAVIHANVQSEDSSAGSLFNLGGSQNDRLSSHYPDADGSITFDINGDGGDARLSMQRSRDDQLAGTADNLVFEAHSKHVGVGPKAHTADASQIIFRNGVELASDNTLTDQFSTTSLWKLASHDGDVRGFGFFQQAMYNEFLVYLAKDNSTPSVQNLIGTAQDDVLTYSGEMDLQRIDGLAGEDTLYVSGTNGLDLAGFPGGVKHVEQFWLENGEMNVMFLSPEALMALDVEALTIRLDADDDVFVGDDEIRHEENLRKTLEELIPTMQFTVLIDGQAVL